LTKKVGESEYYLDLQELFCKKYNVILTDYKIKRRVHRKLEKQIGSREPMKMKVGRWIKKNVNKEGFDKGMKTFNDGVENFTKELEAFGDAFGTDEKEMKKMLGVTKSKKSSPNQIWSPKKTSMRIWSEQGDRPKKKKRGKKPRSKRVTNLDKIWGTKRR
jgi:hypothetical protein